MFTDVSRWLCVNKNLHTPIQHSKMMKKKRDDVFFLHEKKMLHKKSKSKTLQIQTARHKNQSTYKANPKEKNASRLQLYPLVSTHTDKNQPKR